MDEQHNKHCDCEHHCHCGETEWHADESKALTSCIECLVAELHSCPVAIDSPNIALR